MRNIKFRAWDGNRMEYDICVGRHSKDSENCENTVIIIDDGDCWFPDEPYISVMQYTGLKDIKGREIYEGDLIINNSRKKGRPHPVVFFAGKFLADYGLKYDFSYEIKIEQIKVAGNIYENPEVINGCG